MRDAIGNSITDRSILCWHPDPDMIRRGIIVQAVHVSDGGLSLADSNAVSPPTLVVQIVIPIGGTQPTREPAVAEFLCLVNPQAEAAIEGMLEKQRRQ